MLEWSLRRFPSPVAKFPCMTYLMRVNSGPACSIYSIKITSLAIVATGTTSERSASSRGTDRCLNCLPVIDERLP